MAGIIKTSASDDEEDLEALRLAALQTLKKNATSSQTSLGSQKSTSSGSHYETEPKFRSGPRNRGHFPNKRGRFYGGRGSKNGHFHSGRVVSSNLISLTPSIPREETNPKHINESSTDTRLFLPQDRYLNKEIKETKTDEGSSKFDRYKDSDESEEEDSEDDLLKSGSDDEGSPLKLERSDSLEALMQELDDEIQGKSKTKDAEEKPVKVKAKTKKKKKTSEAEKEVEAPGDAKAEILPAAEEKLKEEGEDTKKEEEKDSQKNVQSSDTIKLDTSKDSPNAKQTRERSTEKEPQLKKRRHSPPFQRDFRGFSRNFRNSPPLQKPSFLPGNGPLPFLNNPPPMFNNPPFGPPPVMMNVPMFYDRPISPLLINAESLQTQTMAPLSPRSAAFVLENRAIIEKRKRSPRRSYSRSPSPRSRSISPRRSQTPPRRRSLSPRNGPLSPRKRSQSPRKRSLSPRKRSLSPKKSPLSPRKRSLSPRKRSQSPRKKSLSPLRKRSRSPKRRSVSPRRRSPSPKRRNFSPKPRNLSPKPRFPSPKRRSPSPRRRSLSPRRRDRRDPSENTGRNRPSIRDRLGFKSSSKTDEKDSKGKSQSDPSLQKEDKPLDPILEARKKKFETREIPINKGVIRLKPKDEIKPDKAEIAVSSEAETSIENKTIVTPVEKKEEKKDNIIEETTSVMSKYDILNEDALLEDDELDLEAQTDLFSDEDSGSENEGRFKAKQLTSRKPSVLPFSKLMNGTRKEVKSRKSNEKKEKKASPRSKSPPEKLTETVEIKPTDNVKSSPDSTERSRVRKSKIEKSLPRKKLGVKAERHPKKFERKIEIKIKNPSKYERVDKVETEKGSKTDRDKNVRKVELGVVEKHENTEDDDETEIVVENDEDEAENSINNEGDLRAQLKKKRAEKLHKTSSREGVSSRLLQNALENALPIKKSKKSKSKQLTSSDGRVPIHLRLGLACSSDVFSKPKRKSKKRKNIDTEDQV